MMKHIFARILGLLVLGAFAIVVPEGAQAVTSTGSYYAEPSWDQKLPASTRFVVLSDWNSEAVLDRNTGLVWEKAPSSAIEHWNAARITCINKMSEARRAGAYPPFQNWRALWIRPWQRRARPSRRAIPLPTSRFPAIGRRHRLPSFLRTSGSWIRPWRGARPH